MFGEDRICHELGGRQMTAAVRQVLMIDNASNSELRDKRRWKLGIRWSVPRAWPDVHRQGISCAIRG